MKCHRVSRFLNRRRALVMAVGATIAVGSALSATPAKATSRDGYDRRIAVLNQSSDAIVDLRASDVGRPDWGPDLLGEDVLAPGESGVSTLQRIGADIVVMMSASSCQTARCSFVIT